MAHALHAVREFGEKGMTHMAAGIRDITSDELTLFGDIVGRLQHLSPQDDIRQIVLGDIVKLLRADAGASFIWQEDRQRFSQPVYVGGPREILSLYEDRYQFNDPITSLLKNARRATTVDDVVDRHELTKTEFYNDFLRRDALEWGINIYIVDGDGRDLGDFRIWRRRGGHNFEQREKMLLDVIGPHIRAAIARVSNNGGCLTSREREVAELISRGCTDRDIARILGISFGTVRTHVNRALEKCGCANRTELAASFARHQRSGD